MEEEKKSNASEWQVAKLCLDYQDTETSRIQSKDEVPTYIVSKIALTKQLCSQLAPGDTIPSKNLNLLITLPGLTVTRMHGTFTPP